MKKHRSKFIVVILCSLFWLGTSLAKPAEASLLKNGDAGESVRAVQISLQELGYKLSADGVFGIATDQNLKDFQRRNGLAADGVYGPNTKERILLELRKQGKIVVFPGESLNAIAVNCNLSLSQLMQINGLTNMILPVGYVLKIPPVSNKVELLDWWSEAQYIFTEGKIAKITDVDTGISYQVVRKAGSNHADCQPLTAADTAAMKKAYGGQWSWERRAILVEVDGRIMAASQNGMPHGGQSIYDNNFDGHFCIHFLNGRTHGTNRVDADHQAMVKKAAIKYNAIN